MKLKVGDKLLCKENTKVKIKGKYYTISDIDYLNVYFENDWYSLNPPQEVRKMKLNKLKQC